MRPPPSADALATGFLVLLTGCSRIDQPTAGHGPHAPDASKIDGGARVSNEPHIVIEGVDAVYEAADGDLTALSNVDLRFERGEFISIIGPSGCGKSTLLRLIGGLQAPTRGRVLIDGRAPREAQRQKQIGFVFQDPSLLRLAQRHRQRAPAAAGQPPQGVAATRSAWSTSSA